MPDTYSISYITNAQRNAPAINGTTPGSLIAVLDALLITGWGLAAPSALTVASGVATATFASATTWDVGAVIEVTGASPAEINGRWRVATSSGNTTTFATTAPEGTYTGTMGIKYAPAGWEKVFTGTNKAVYRSADILGNRHYLRVDDTANLFARVCGYESMTDIDTGTGLFPTAAMLSGGGYWHKSTTANSTAIPYLFTADSRAVTVALCQGVGGGAAATATALQGFGDGIALNPAGDAWCSFLSCHGSTASSYWDCGGLSGAAGDSSANGLTCHPRGWQGIGSAVLARPVPEAGRDTQLSGACDIFGAGPSLVDGQIKISRVFLKDQVAGAAPRCIAPGAYYIPQSGAAALFPVPFALSDGPAGRKMAAIHTGSGATPAGAALLDVTGPWR